MLPLQVYYYTPTNWVQSQTFKMSETGAYTILGDHGMWSHEIAIETSWVHGFIKPHYDYG